MINQKTYIADFAKRSYQISGAFLKEYKEANPCCDCNQFFPSVCMDFDHIINKSYTISHMRTYKLEAIKKEIKKCDLVCSNCHRIRTSERRQS